ncbi:androgen-dependent TFPI-regulating protein [Tiliqua scincoides]|uniref:androgen-dependent TFPI-regulating protein n=1 Tax=Tiliqua scincoides TaxID=71010 RepID=UPI0034628DE9
MKTSSLFYCHGLLLAWYAFLVYAISELTSSRGRATSVAGIVPYGGQWKFLTVLNLLFQVIFFGISLLADAFVLMKKFRIAKFIFPFRDLLFGALVFPICMFVFAMFWTLYAYDRELVYPKSIDFVIPAWMNQAMHTSILPLTLLDLLITPRRYPSKGKGLSLLTITMVAYLCWLLWIHFVTGNWVYPVFEALSPFSKAAFFAGSGVFLLLAYNAGEFLCRMIWGDSVVVVDTYKRKSK